jgi:hypothetical protein
VDVLFGLVRRFPVIVVIGVVAIGGIVFREHLSGAAADLRVGDCFDVPAEIDVVTDVQHRPCGDAHDAEVFFVADYSTASDAAFPTDAAFDRNITDECLPAFEAYTGRDWDASTDLDYFAFIPLEEGWRDGDREVLCYLARVDGAKVTGSLRATAG